jgi:uncharacterized protein YjiS (DUF1127 family)
MQGIIGEWAAWAAAGPQAMVREFRGWYNERAMIAALGALPDEMLKDIGLYRGEIPGAARRRWRGPGAA